MHIGFFTLLDEMVTSCVLIEGTGPDSSSSEAPPARESLVMVGVLSETSSVSRAASKAPRWQSRQVFSTISRNNQSQG